MVLTFLVVAPSAWAMYEMPRTEQGGMQHITLAEENHQQMWDDTLMIGRLLHIMRTVKQLAYFG
jgi:unsaturated rhamnogalacturonyl hydrolase